MVVWFDFGWAVHFFFVSSGSAGFGSSLNSNIALQAVSGGSLLAAGSGVGIGATANDSCGSVTVCNCSLSGLGGVGVGVGWDEYRGVSRLERLMIQGGDIEAMGTYYGSGIGTGWRYCKGTSTMGNLMIVSGNITASSSYQRSGIGTGDVSGGIPAIGNIIIVNGNITVNSSSYGSDIGTGHDSGASTIDNLTIMSGNITASSSFFGSGIETGRNIDGGHLMIEILSILGGRIKVNRTESGIGSGFEGSEVKLLRFAGIVVLFCTVTITTKFPVNASLIVLSDTSLTITTQYNTIECLV